MNKNVFYNATKVGSPHRLELVLAKLFGKKVISVDLASDKSDYTVVTHFRIRRNKVYILKQVVEKTKLNGQQCDIAIVDEAKEANVKGKQNEE